MKRLWFICGIAALIGSANSVKAINEADSVVVIYNNRIPESKRIAEHYAERRHVPKAQIFGFDLPSTESMTRAEFRKDLQQPLLKKLQLLKLWRIGPGEMRGTNGTLVHVDSKVVEAKIRYAVLCYGVPLIIKKDPDLKEPIEEVLRPELRRNEASVDSDLACLPRVERDFSLAGPLRNPFYTSTNAWTLHPTNGLLIVSRLDGPSPEIANALVDKAIQAETDGLWGRAYVDFRNAPEQGLKIGDEWMRGAAEMCRFMGFETVIDETANTFPAGFPMSQIALYFGWYTENVDGPFTRPKVEFMPGAFAYHLHSFSAASLRTTNRYWAGPLLAKGATVTMGNVDEPYLTGTPDLGTFAARFLYYRFSFGEAAYASQNVLSWQTTVVGDPLYRPFEKPPQQIHQELEARQNKLVEWSHLRVVNMGLSRRQMSSDQVFQYLESVPITKESAVLQEKMGDLCALEGKPASALHAYEEALKLGPSLIQRLRLRLIVGEKMPPERSADAYANYQKLLEELPDYPDKNVILNKLVLLGEKLGKKEEAAKYREQLPPPASGTSTNK